MRRSAHLLDLPTLGMAASALLVVLVGMFLSGASVAAVLFADVAVLAVVTATLCNGVLDSVD